MKAYCVKCKEKREIANADPVFASNGAPATRGNCPHCGTRLYRMGRTPAHEELNPSPRTQRKKKKKRKAKKNGKLVIVESPAKARTVARYLGKGFHVEASVGHVRDLLRSQLSVDVENDFKPKYRVPNDKRPVVKEIKAMAKTSEEVYLATDLDREGEAIAWHLIEAADIDPDTAKRVVFHEITAAAIKEAFANPRQINNHLVDAQQARRVLDRLVGYNLSPLLWRKVRGRLSAGRVQSVTLRLIVDREREIGEFVPEEFWTIEATFRIEDRQETFIAKLVKINDANPDLKTEVEVLPVVSDMETADYAVGKVKRGERRRKPAAPFTTSTLQQEASRRLGFSSRRTMALAQQLYEGVDVGNGGSTGLITYIRTDSTNISTSAQQEARQYIQSKYNVEYLPAKPPTYKTKSRRAQEAHEAIRPTSVRRLPSEIKKFLKRDQLRLYRLIWQRFVASQMADAVYDTVTVEVVGTTTSHQYLLRTTGSSVRFPGFLILYEESKEGNQESGNGDIANIPLDLQKGQKLKLVNLTPEQRFTQPPPRFSEATLVRTMEDNGIGRPSTYAPTLGNLQQRGYVFRENRRLYPTETGMLVNDLLIQHFPNVLDVHFTAHMEEDLDLVASGEREWVDVVREFYDPFSEQLHRAQQEMPEVKVEPEKIGRTCPKCGNELVIRWGRFGKFISCSNFPACRHTEPWLEKIGVQCPKDGGDVVERKTRKGRVFFGCTNYPACDFTSWKRPLVTPCPHCAGLLVVASKQHAQCLDCENRFPLDHVVPREPQRKTP